MPFLDKLIKDSLIECSAPASIPHVGWDIIKSSGFDVISLPITNFCKLPPDKLEALASKPGVTTLKFFITVLVCFSIKLLSIIPNFENFKGVCEMHGDCWEGLASGPSMESRWGYEASKLSKSHEAWEKEAELLAHGLINIIANHSPDKIIMGGGVMSQKHLFPMIRSNIEKTWNDYTPLVPLSNLISEPGLGLDSGIIGSISLISN